MDRSTERGLTLVEVLLALCLSSTALLALALVFPVAVAGIVEAGAQTTAILLTRQVLETARTADPAGLDALATGGFVEIPGHAGFQRSVRVAAGTPTARTTTVTVTVRVTSAGAHTPREITLAGILTR